MSNKELADYIADNLDFDQLILEFWKPEEPNSGWVHCSYKGADSNRKEYLRAIKSNGRTSYQKEYSEAKGPTTEDVNNSLMS